MGMTKIKIAGAWSGVLELELEEWTVSMLREEVIRRSGCVPPESINLICAGKLLKDGDGTEKLAQLGIKNNAKILASKVSPDRGKSFKEESLAEEERSSRLSRLKSVLTVYLFIYLLFYYYFFNTYNSWHVVCVCALNCMINVESWVLG